VSTFLTLLKIFLKTFLLKKRMAFAVRIERRGVGGYDGDYDVPENWGNVFNPDNVYKGAMPKGWKAGCEPWSQLHLTGGTTQYTNSSQLYPANPSAIDTRNMVEGTNYGTYDELQKYSSFPQTNFSAGPEPKSEKKKLYVRNPTQYMLWRDPTPPVPRETKPAPAVFTIIHGSNGRYY
jgi:hypothetical protein